MNAKFSRRYGGRSVTTIANAYAAALTNTHAPRILLLYEWLLSYLRHLPPDYLQLAIRWLRPPFLTSQENGRPASQAGIVHGA
jgi:hypothetical protein